MSGTVDCVRCGRRTEALPAAPQPGPIGEEIQAKICPDCWAEWQRAEVMVINELRLNFMDPKSQDVLAEHLRKFLMLSPE